MMMNFRSDKQRKAMFANLFSRNKFTLSDDERRVLRQKILAKTIPDSDIAMKRYGNYDLEKIGAGSDRRVYNVEDEYALKVAKNRRGLVQNEQEGMYYPEILPELEERGDDFVLVQKADIDTKKSREFVKNFDKYGLDDYENKTSDFQRSLESVDAEYDTDTMGCLACDLAWGDFVRPSSWGWIEDKPVLIDAGTLYYGALQDKTMAVDDWRSVLQKRRAARKEGYKDLSREPLVKAEGVTDEISKDEDDEIVFESVKLSGRDKLPKKYTLIDETYDNVLGEFDTVKEAKDGLRLFYSEPVVVSLKDGDDRYLFTSSTMGGEGFLLKRNKKNEI